MVRQIHQEYVKAGAEILETNTFGANRMRLAAFGFAEKLRGDQPGRRAAGARSGARKGLRGGRDRARWACASSRSGPPLSPKRAHIFREQVEALLEAGVDLLILETFGDLDELREAIFAAREAAGPRYRRSSRRSPSTTNGNLPRRHRYGDVHPPTGRMAGGRDRAELLGRVPRPRSKPSSG